MGIFGSAESIDVARLLLDLLIIVTAAKVVAELAERLRVPAVLGEIVAGVLVGPSVIGLIQLDGARGISVAVLAEIGVLLLLLSVGMETDLVELRKVGGASMSVAVVGVVVPFAAGLGVGLLFGESTNTALLFGAALTATSVGITARVFGDLRALASIESRIVLGAAVADDVLGLIILTVVVKVVTGGSVGIGTVAQTFGLALLFLLGTGLLGVFVVPRLFRQISRRASSGATVVVAAFALMIGFATLADVAKLAFIIGGFMAGIALGRTDQHERVAADLGAVGNVFIPVFFLSIGINADLSAMAKPSVLLLAGAMTVVAVLGKLCSALVVSAQRADRLLIGLGMIPRGEVGLIFAAIGLSSGVLDTDQYGALLLVILVTTLVTPPLLRLRIGQGPRRRAGLTEQVVEAEPAAGWISATGDTVGLAAIPPVSQAVTVALAAARHASSRTPSEPLLDWFALHRQADLVWDASHTAALVDLLRDDSPRSWRWLEVTGVLERTLPEIATAMRRRRADMSDLDPLGSLRFAVVDRLHAQSSSGVGETAVAELDDDLLLAALVADVCADTESAQSLARRFGGEAQADRIVSIVADANLLRRRAHGPAGFDENEILQMATHLGTARHARLAFVLAVALGDLTRVVSDALAAQYMQVQEALRHPDLTGGEADNLAGTRRLAAQRLLEDAAPIERLRHASNTYLLAHEPEELARHARLVEPLPLKGVVRIAVSPEPEPDHWKIDVACRDMAGLLARLADALARQDLDIAAADLTTWPDGAALSSFVVRTSTRPKAAVLAQAFEARLGAQVQPIAQPAISLTFDNDALPWLTVCTVTGPDEPGVLLAVSSAFAAAGAVIHSARIASEAGHVSDRFAVSDRLNRKLSDEIVADVRSALAAGKVQRRKRWSRRR